MNRDHDVCRARNGANEEGVVEELRAGAITEYHRRVGAIQSRALDVELTTSLLCDVIDKCGGLECESPTVSTDTAALRNTHCRSNDALPQSVDGNERKYSSIEVMKW